MNVQGIVKYVYDNRLTKDGTPNKFPNFKFKVENQEIVLWSSIKPSYLEKGKDRKSTRLNSSHMSESRMPSSA